MRTRVKFCGITCAEDAAAAAACGADAIGLNFHPPAAVAVSPDEAAGIARRLPPFVEVVALFVNAESAAVRAAADAARPHLLQFHGEEEAGFCMQFGVPYIKVCRVQSAEDIRRAAAAHPECRALLLDSHVAGTPGGSGRRFDWRLIPSDLELPLIVAGGLTAENVGEVVRQVRPWGVDVSSGIAGENRRRKNQSRMRDFMRSVQHADSG